MRLPWVSRSKLDMYRRLYREAASRATSADSLADTLRDQLDKAQAALERAQHERNDATTKLLRVGFGINPFHELYVAETGAAHAAPQDTASPAHDTNQVRPGMSHEEMQQLWTKEAMDLYGNIRDIQRHVQMRSDQFYGANGAPSPVSAEEYAAALKIANDLDAAIEEGKLAAQKEF